MHVLNIQKANLANLHEHLYELRPLPKAKWKILLAYLSFEILQSITVFLLVFTMIKGKWMTELEGGGRFACCSA